MPIYSNIASTLARQGPKTFIHGYAQSLIAATHSQVYATQNRSGLGIQRKSKVSSLLSSYHFQNAFHKSAQSSSAVVQVRSEKNDGGLDAYFDAWKKTHIAGEPEKEWTQFQFAKRIEWKPDPINVENGVLSNAESHTLTESHQLAFIPDAEITKSNNHVDVSEDMPVALANMNVAPEEEITYKNEKAIFEAELSIVAAHSSHKGPPSSAELFSEKKNDRTTLASDTSIKTDQQTQKYGKHLTNLSENQKFEEIPIVFEAMLVAGVQPSAICYNALFQAAIHLPAERIHVVPKVLDVYSDMLRRRVSPNTTTYEILLGLLSSRTLEVNFLKQSLEEKRARFGGMDVKGKFMLDSSEMEYAILAEDDRIDLTTRLFDASIVCHRNRKYSLETYELLISACSATGRISEMIRIFEHMSKIKIIPTASIFCHLINGVAQIGELRRAVDYYDSYKELAIGHDCGDNIIPDRQDHMVYASLVKAYVTCDRIPGALKFYNKIVNTHPENSPMRESVINDGLIQGLLERRMFSEAFDWAKDLGIILKPTAMAKLTVAAADIGMKSIACEAFSYLFHNSHDSTPLPIISMLALSIREGDILAAQNYWSILSQSDYVITSSFIEPTAMYAVAMIGSGKVIEGLDSADHMFHRMRLLATNSTGHINDEIDEGIAFIHSFMAARGITDPRQNTFDQTYLQNLTTMPIQASLSYNDSYDPYAMTTDFKGSSIISDELDRSSGRGKSSRLNEVLGRLENIRRAGRHPRYIIYAKLISTAAHEGRMNLVHDIFAMARTDIPMLQQYPLVRFGWIAILDSMVGACLTLGDRNSAAEYHQELLSMGATPTANTFGLYITTLKGCTKTFDEAADAINIFLLAKSQGVEPSSFLYNALIGKLGKARRIDDCLFYFAEMRSRGIRPTSVTYGTIVNALCRVSDEKLAEQLFEEMESMQNYKARPAPYNSIMQFFLHTKREKNKVLSYYERMKSRGIQPTSHTYKLLVDAHATLEPINMAAAEAVLDVIRSTGQQPEPVHYSSLIHAKGCVMHDVEGAKTIFDSVLADPSIRPQACIYQALFESMVANHRVSETEPIVREMPRKGVDMTPYIANTLIHGWASEKNICKAEEIYALVRREEREPSTYEAITRAYLAFEDRQSANSVVQEMLGRNYPSAVSSKICDLLGNKHSQITI